MKIRSSEVFKLCGWILVSWAAVEGPQQVASQQLQREVQEQRPGTSQSSETQSVLREKTSVVNVTVTVTDKYNRLVTGLGPEHFEIFEDKVRQKIEFFSDADLPVSIGIIFDVSASMEGKLARSREALSAFIQTCHRDDDFFLVAFNQHPTVMADFTDGDTCMSKLAKAEAKGQTALYDALYVGLEKVQRGRHSKQALLLITDGEDTASRHSYRELNKLLREANAQIYCIGIMDFYGMLGEILNSRSLLVLNQISQATGGLAFYPNKEGELEEAVTRIALELRRQYNLGYIPTRQEWDGKWRKIKVHLLPPAGLPKLSVRAREGYFAVPQP